MFITNAARTNSTVCGSLRDVQMLAGHSALSTTQRSCVRLTKWKACLELVIDRLPVGAKARVVMPALPDTPDLNRTRVFWNVPKG